MTPELTNAEAEIKDILADRPYLTKEDLARAIALAIQKALDDQEKFIEEYFSDALSELNL